MGRLLEMGSKLGCQAAARRSKGFEKWLQLRFLPDFLSSDVLTRRLRRTGNAGNPNDLFQPPVVPFLSSRISNLELSET